MKIKTKITAVVFSLVLAVGSLFVAFNTNEAEARMSNDEICGKLDLLKGDCIGAKENCLCPIIIVPE